MGRNKETSLRRRIKTPNKQLSMFLHSLLYLDFNVGSAGLSIKADWRLIFDGFFVFLKLIKPLDTFSYIVIKM